MEKIKDYKIKVTDRKIIKKELKRFYNKYPGEAYTINWFVKKFKKRLKKYNKDAWIAVIGETSSGKSLFSLMVLILFGRPATLKKNITYIPLGSEITDKFDQLNYNVLQVDEAAREMRTVNWQSKSQQKVNLKSMTDRFRNNMVLMLMPNFNEFTKSMRQGMMLFRCIMMERTPEYVRVLVQRKSRDFRNRDPWGDEYASKIYEKISRSRKDITDEQRLNIERSLNNYVCDFIVPNLESILPHVCKRYEDLKVDSRRQVIEDERFSKFNLRMEKYKYLYENLLARVTKIIRYNRLNLGIKDKVSIKEMSKELGITDGKFKDYLNKDFDEKLDFDQFFSKKLANKKNR